VARATVDALSRAFGSVPADLVAAVGPSIGPCCYEVGAEVRERFGAHAGAWFTAGPRGRPHLDLWRATSDQLLAAGLPPEHVHLSRLCTATWPAVFYSYRREGSGTGRMAGVIRVRASGA